MYMYRTVFMLYRNIVMYISRWSQSQSVLLWHVCLNAILLIMTYIYDELIHGQKVRVTLFLFVFFFLPFFMCKSNVAGHGGDNGKFNDVRVYLAIRTCNFLNDTN